MDEINRQLGQRIQEAWQVKGWTQEDLAHHASLDFSYVNQLENGKRNPSLATLYKISTALEISLKDLLPGWPSADYPDGYHNPSAAG